MFNDVLVKLKLSRFFSFLFFLVELFRRRRNSRLRLAQGSPHQMVAFFGFISPSPPPVLTRLSVLLRTLTQLVVVLILFLVLDSYIPF